ncbi:hypothetical protein Esi_0341_0015 [Ectocarpus siliculosus]|uniref:Uncharacterized protein n=1 Tax=Ectocarpus siliculosus TaxID=2880 RepID=D7FYC3_ECTSI|nr:hypothetical protein Esi_0341_0015 [Ectocarpus siliculosus]|eukprot:CBJ32465.1 hypothetical protein Esi_0341_0015 [Ectocarpus siliculosus]
MATSFAHLRQRFRLASFVGWHSRLADGPKYVSLSALKSAFGVAGVVLTEDEVGYLVKKFADNRRRIDWKRLMIALDVGPPADFTDPDRSFLDNLPQPYRLIVSVLETEIVDRAWELVVERHPELDTSPADEARAAADIDLKRSCHPFVRLLDPHSPLPAHAGDVKPVAAAAKEGEAIAADGFLDGRGSSELLFEGKDRNGDADDDGGGGENDAGNVSTMQWDNRGQFLFTGGRDGSVCVRLAGAVKDIGVQIRSSSLCGETFSEGNAKSAAVTFLSRPVGSLGGRSSSVRIAAVVTSSCPDSGHGNPDQTGNREAGQQETERDAGAEPRPACPSSAVSVLEMTVPRSRAGDEAGGSPARGSLEHHQGARSEHGADAANSGNRRNYAPAFRVICTVELHSEQENATAVSCTLSPDGRRLAVTTASGRVSTWSLPPVSAPLERHRNRSPQQSAREDDDVDGVQPGSSRTSAGHGRETPKEGMAGQQGGERGAGVGESGAVLAGRDDDASTSTNTAAKAAAAETAEPPPPPTQLGQPEFTIPHVPSPEELSHAKALQEYRKRVEAGEIQEPTSTQEEEEEEGCTPPPKPPQLSGLAHHLARVDFIPAADGRLNGGGGSTGGLAVWRSNSNVCRLFRLPPPVYDGDGGQRQTVEGGNNDGGVELSRTGTVAASSGFESADKTGIGSEGSLAAKYDISRLPSVEWVLPSPITVLAVCEEETGGEAQDDGREKGGGWSCCGGADAPAPLVAIGTENGGVYLGDAALGTTRAGLSRHRARVTALAFHGKRFLVSGSDDEMIQIHHLTVADPTGAGGDRRCVGGTPRLRCLHDARGSGIVRLACFREMPLAVAEDTSGRVVVYDLLSGTMLGVLALKDDAITSVAADRPDRNGDGAAVSHETVAPKAGIIWSEGGECMAVVMPQEQETSVLSPTRSDSGGETLGVWSASDLMWELSPGMRAMVGEERPLSPRDVAELFYGLLPRYRKDPEIMLQNMSHQYDPGRGDTAPLTTGTTNPDPASTRTKAGGRSSRGTGSGSGRLDRSNTPQRAAGRDRVAAKKAPSNTVSTNVTRNPTTRTPPHYQHPTTLTERNVARLLGAGGRGGPMGGVLACTGEGGAVGKDGPAPWGMEVGAAARVKRYMEARHTERAVRQARLENVTRNLLQAL